MKIQLYDKSSPQFAKRMDRIVRRSKAFSNPFFENCAGFNSPIFSDRVAPFCLNWYFITKHFALSSQEYDAVVARELKAAKGKNAKLLRKLLTESAGISGDDLGIGHEELYVKNGGAGLSPSDRTHYVLWGRITEKILQKSKIPLISTDMDELTLSDASLLGIIENETRKLIQRIERESASLDGGAAIYQVVETIAYQVMLAFIALIEKVRIDGRRFLSKRDLLYLNIHKPLEKEHDKQSSDIIAIVGQVLGEEHHSIIESKVHALCDLFGRFWEKMNELTFGK